MNNMNDKVEFPCGISMKNRFMLAPLTNTQSDEDGCLSDEEFHWLRMRAQGGFGLTMSCASHVQCIGKGFTGQLGIFSDKHINGLQRLTDAIKSHGSLAVAQLHHAGMRSPASLIGTQPVCPSYHQESNARALSLDEVKFLRDDFIRAAVRAKKSGYDGVEIHGAHGYILCQFLSADINKRQDDYGGSLENRSRIIFEIIEGVRASCGSNFLVGVRLSPERFGVRLREIKAVCQALIHQQMIDFLDLSLWDVFKKPVEIGEEDEKVKQPKSLLEHFLTLDYQNVKLTVAGKINTAQDVSHILNTGVDFVGIGRAAILHHDFPRHVMQNPHFTPIKLPVSKTYLKQEGLSEKFINYMRAWKGFVEAS